MKRLYNLVGACLSAALLAACGGGSGLSSSTPTSVAPPLTPLLGAPGLSQSPRSQPAFGRSASHRTKKNVQIESVLYSFAGGSDGEEPQDDGLTDVGGMLYGTTFYGGSSDDGTVFKTTTSGTESVLYTFAGGSDGVHPVGSLLNVGGTLYGTTLSGGSSGCYSTGCGTVFKISTSGAYAQVYTFSGGSDGGIPVGGLTKVGSTLYGTTSGGGANGNGTVFTIKCRLAGCTESVLYSFAGGSDGASPQAALSNVGGTLYGTTLAGGSSGEGTVFKITTSGTESVLYSFAGGSDGENPQAALSNVGGTLYGTTFAGGSSGDGTLFQITTSGAYAQLYSFSGYPHDGAFPYAGLTRVGGVLYGTTESGGASGYGTVFALLKKGPEFVLYSFAGGSDGESPRSGLTNVDGTLYGMTIGGGSSGEGTIFSLSL